MFLQQPQFHDDEAARIYFERIRWPDGRVCPHCGVIGAEYATKRAGRYRCGARECRKDFSTTTGTVMEQSHIGLSKWMWVFYQMCASKKGISSHQVRRSLGVSMKAAWFMTHRVREAMKAGGIAAPLGGPGKVVMVDETYHGKVENPSDVRVDGTPFKQKRLRGHGGGRGGSNKRPIVTLVESGGQARTFHVADANLENVQKIVRENVHRESRLHTDASSLYKGLGKEFAEHESVRHSLGEYVRYTENGPVHNNACESYFSVFKRGMNGVYQHCDEKHLHRYLGEFDFRHNTRSKLGIEDKERADLALAGAEGKRLTYRRTHSEGREA
jgi:transposase-like protein